jgi:hypothetical protein
MAIQRYDLEFGPGVLVDKEAGDFPVNSETIAFGQHAASAILFLVESASRPFTPIVLIPGIGTGAEVCAIVSYLIKIGRSDISVNIIAFDKIRRR